MSVLYHLFRPLIFQLDPETAHQLVGQIAKAMNSCPSSLRLLEKLIGTSRIKKTNNPLSQKIWGKTFENPIGLAAGYDKNGDYLPFLQALGFGFVEIGSITALASLGNPKPRLFRLPLEKAIINRMGLNNRGVDAIVRALQESNVLSRLNIPVGINISKTHHPSILGAEAIKDFLTSYQKIQSLDYTYCVINISCPNTREGKTFEDDPLTLKTLLSELTGYKNSLPQAQQKPLLLKLSPDLNNERLKGILNLVTQFELNGLVVSNTSTNRSMLKTSVSRLHEIGSGGFSGLPIKNLSTRLLENISLQLKLKNDSEFVLIGVGGILSKQDVEDKLTAGARLVQVYSGLIYNGPSWINELQSNFFS